MRPAGVDPGELCGIIRQFLQPRLDFGAIAQLAHIGGKIRGLGVLGAFADRLTIRGFAGFDLLFAGPDALVHKLAKPFVIEVGKHAHLCESVTSPRCNLSRI